MSGSARVVGAVEVQLFEPLSTTAGDLAITAYNGVATFGATAPFPEIDPAGMGSVLALIGGGLGLLERRRKRA